MKNIICVIGTNEVERSIFTVSLANLLMDKNKVLIIDFVNNNLHEILGIKKYSQKIRNKIKNNNLLNFSKENPKSFLKFIWCFYIYFMSYSIKHLKFSINQHICKFYRGIFVRTVFFTVNY